MPEAPRFEASKAQLIAGSSACRAAAGTGIMQAIGALLFAWAAAFVFPVARRLERNLDRQYDFACSRITP